jgi:hypothetical protein
MPLYDHFRPPLSEERSWDAFHSRWATALADDLNLRLPAIGCFAEALATRGRVGKDAAFPPEIQVLVFTDSARALVGAIELVSPGNKDRPAARRAFAVKCLSYLHSGVGLNVADIVTERSANLHDEMAQVAVSGVPAFPGSPALYAAAYRPFKRDEQDRVAVWPVELRVGESLPVLPLWLRNQESPIRIDLEAAYAEACQKCLID